MADWLRMDLRDCLSAHRWFGATDAQRGDWLAQACALAGPAFEVIGVQDFWGNPIGRLRHGSGLAFSLIPGGVFDMGISEGQIDQLLGLLDGRDEQEEVEFTLGLAGPWETRSVDVMPFLIASEPLDASSLKALTGQDSDTVGGCFAPAMLSEVHVCLTLAGVRPCTSEEWEYAARAGSHQLFSHGDPIPDDDIVPVNAFGVAGMGSLPEVCVDGEVRGGAAVVFPWQSCGEWLSMLCGWSSPSSSGSYFASVRPAASLFAG